VVYCVITIREVKIGQSDEILYSLRILVHVSNSYSRMGFYNMVSLANIRRREVI
jgi:hypothetical protein